MSRLGIKRPRLDVKKILKDPKMRKELLRRACESIKVIKKWDESQRLCKEADKREEDEVLREIVEEE